LRGGSKEDSEKGAEEKLLGALPGAQRKQWLNM